MKGGDGNWRSLFMNKTRAVMIISYGWIFWKINKTLGLKISSYNGICKHSERFGKSQKQTCFKSDQKADHLPYGSGGRGAAILFHDKGLYRNQQCGNGHGFTDAACFLFCNVRKGRDAVGKNPDECNQGEADKARHTQVRSGKPV